MVYGNYNLFTVNAIFSLFLIDFFSCIQWLGMGNQELLEYFHDYNAVKARHSYGPLGHRGMSVLIFEGTAVGYSNAERLNKHFEAEGTDRETWDRRRVLFYPGGRRQLYGFLATREDMDSFNRHCQGLLFFRNYIWNMFGPVSIASNLYN